MASEDITQKFQGLKLKEKQDINILLLGETGVGKSTFINAIANYLHFITFEDAEEAEELHVLIPSVINVPNKKGKMECVNIGSADNNEYLEVGAAATQDVKTYVFPIGEGRLRLIDTPGMADPRGIDQDDLNCENILAYLSQLKELHAICFLMRPTITRKTVLFDYCVQLILSRLEKSASKNIIFIFTNTRGTDYSPSESFPVLKVLLDQIKAKPPYVDIPFEDNVFPLDNEAFRYLAASKKGVALDESESGRNKFITSWNHSAIECWRLISYIVGSDSCAGLTPHQLLNTISINEARRIIVQLSQPLADISQLIHDNITILERHKSNLQAHHQDMDELKNKLYIPIITLEVTQLTQPTTVCTSTKCSDLVQVEGVKKWHYRQRCHNPCYLTNVEKEIIGDTNLLECAAMNGGRVCLKCACDYTVHMHVYYMTKSVAGKIEDNNVKSSITKKEEALAECERLILQITQRKTELERERDVIVKSTAEFAHFLQNNAISPFNDSYKAYTQYLIDREKSLGRNSDPKVIDHLEKLLRQYEEMKAAFDKSLNSHKTTGLNKNVAYTVTAQSVMNTINTLYNLKHNGKKIHELLKSQKASRTSEYNNTCEYIHPKFSKKPTKNRNMGVKRNPLKSKANDSQQRRANQKFSQQQGPWESRSNYCDPRTEYNPLSYPSQDMYNGSPSANQNFRAPQRASDHGTPLDSDQGDLQQEQDYRQDNQETSTGWFGTIKKLFWNPFGSQKSEPREFKVHNNGNGESRPGFPTFD